MKNVVNRRFVVVLTALAVSIAVCAQDYSRLSERSIMGTARYVGMGGAMTAIGGDPSASLANPAGLGLYRRTEVMLTTDVMIDQTRQEYIRGFEQRVLPMLPQASVVLCFPGRSIDETGVQFNSLMFSYNRVHTFNRSFYAVQDNGDASLGSLLRTADVMWDIDFCDEAKNRSNSFALRETGYVNEYAVDWGMNISNKWFVGAGLHVQSYLFSSEADFREDFSISGNQYYNKNRASILVSGVGANLTAGLIYRPISWVRLGFSIHTPSLSTVTISTSGNLEAKKDTLGFSYAPDTLYRYRDYHQPLKTSISAACQFGAYGMFALQYDYSHANFMNDLHTLRAGLEIIPILGLYINAGYAFESTFKPDQIVPMDNSLIRQDTHFRNIQRAHYASIAFGYRGTHMMVQAAYQYRWQRTNLYAHEWVETPYDMISDTHRIILTIGWHRL